MHLLESADEWPFLREVIGKGGDDGGEEEEETAGEGRQEHLLCDALVGEPFYYRVGAHEGCVVECMQWTAVAAAVLMSSATVDAERYSSTERITARALPERRRH